MTTYCDLNEEVRCDYLVTKEMKQLWNIQLAMLNKLLEVCKKHDLIISVDSGTMIGAVRHHGYIPWDDDIDVTMPRKDYDKLIAIAPNEFEHPFFFQCPYTEKGYYRGHAQMRYDNTTMILPFEGYMGRKFHQGIFIDIFPLDITKDDTTELLKGKEGADILNYLWLRNATKKEKLFRLHTYAKLWFSLGDKRKWKNLKLYSYFEDIFRKEKCTDDNVYAYRTLHLTNVKPKIKIKEDWIKEVVYMPFEKLSVPVFKHYDDILTMLYGDYMTPVKAPSAHGMVILDTNVNYTEYLPKTEWSWGKVFYMTFRHYVGFVLRKLGLKKAPIAGR